MTIPGHILTTTCDIYRPFGAGAPTTTGVPCRLVSCLRWGHSFPTGVADLLWSHCIDVDQAVDIRDGCTRAVGANAVTYADGDEVRIPSGAGSTRYVVVWVEIINRGAAVACKRAYLLRHSASWPGP